MSLLYTNNREQDLVDMIAAEVSRTFFGSEISPCFSQVHVGTQNCTKNMENYVYKRTRDGVHYLDLAKTWEKLMIAARIIGAIQSKNPKDVLVSDFFSNAPNPFWFN